MFKKEKTKKQSSKEPTLLKKIMFNVLAVLIAIVCIASVAIFIGYRNIKTAGFDDKDALIKHYVESLNDLNEMKLQKCFCIGARSQADQYADMETLMEYAKSEKETQNVNWDSENISIEWSSNDTDAIRTELPGVEIEDSAYGIAFIPLTQITNDGTTLEEEDVYQFIVYQANNKWYIAAYIQVARNITGAINPQGDRLSEDEINQWIFSLAKEIGSDIVGYLYVDNYWSEVQDEKRNDDRIKTFITTDQDSYMTMACIKDEDIDDFKEYSASIIKKSSQKYGDIIESEGLIGQYKADVQIAQNQETNARIITWTFKTNETSKFTHVITLEALSDYDASTYVNTFHLTKEHKDTNTTTQKTHESK